MIIKKTVLIIKWEYKKNFSQDFCWILMIKSDPINFQSFKKPWIKLTGNVSILYNKISFTFRLNVKLIKLIRKIKVIIDIEYFLNV